MNAVNGSTEILQPGLLATVQDRGRSGWEAFGISRGGSIDLYAALWANRLAGNPADAALLETTLLGPSLVTSIDCWIATTGAEVVTVEKQRYPAWAGFWVRAGENVTVEKIAGARAYIAFHGGIAVDSVLGSRATNLEAGFGGLEGRGLRRGDVLPLGDADPVPYGRHQCLRHWSPRVLRHPFEVRTVLGPHDHAFSAAAREAFFESEFRVSPQSNHVGLRLDGAQFANAPNGTRVSEPMPVGGIQITPKGQPIVLLNARGTIGGYSLLATVISPDVWLLGQARPGDRLRFRDVSLDEAQTITRRAYGELANTRAHVAPLRPVRSV